jgi:apolipoprotein N-acyltransferase
MRFFLALVCGAIYPLGFAPFELWPLTLLSVLGLVWLMDKADGSHSWVLWCFAFGKFAVGVSWVYVSMNVYAGTPPVVAVPLVVLFVIILSFFYWPAGWAYGRWSIANESTLLNVAFFAALFIGTEWLLTWLFTGFPWLFVGHAMLGTPLHGMLPIVGVLGTGLVAVAIVGLIFLSAKRRARAFAWAAVAVVLVSWLVGQIPWVTEVSKHTVALVQANMDQDRKWLPEEGLPNLRRHLDLSNPHWDAELIVWPEAAITMFDATDALDFIDIEGKKTSTSVVVGVPKVERFPDGEYEVENTALGLGTADGRFSKHHLVPFGEYVPLAGILRGLIEFFDLPMSLTVAGDRDQTNLKLALGGKIVEAAMAICYEVAYGESMRRRAQTAGLLISISNDTWFGASIGPLQHMQIAQTRSAENGRWLVRATNNGITAIVDHTGTITAELPRFEAGALRGEFAVMRGRTAYNRFGDWPFLLTLAVVFGLTFKRSLKS